MNYICFSSGFFKYKSAQLHFERPLESYPRPVTKLQHHLAEQQCNQTLQTVSFLHFQCLLVAGQAPISSHLTLTPLVTTYKNVTILVSR